MENSVVKVIKQKEKLVRDMVEKKVCNSVWCQGWSEAYEILKRNLIDKESVKKVNSQAEEESDSTVEETEEVTRIGKYVEGDKGTIKLRFKYRIAYETVLSDSWKL